jgi:hypothetical protein
MMINRATYQHQHIVYPEPHRADNQASKQVYIVSDNHRESWEKSCTELFMWYWYIQERNNLDLEFESLFRNRWREAVEGHVYQRCYATCKWRSLRSYLTRKNTSNNYVFGNSDIRRQLIISVGGSGPLKEFSGTWQSCQYQAKLSWAYGWAKLISSHLQRRLWCRWRTPPTPLAQARRGARAWRQNTTWKRS